MSKVAHQPDPVMLDEQSFEQFGSDQVAYKVWCSIDTAFELLGQFEPLLLPRSPRTSPRSSSRSSRRASP